MNLTVATVFQCVHMSMSLTTFSPVEIVVIGVFQICGITGLEKKLNSEKRHVLLQTNENASFSTYSFNFKIDF